MAGLYVFFFIFQSKNSFTVSDSYRVDSIELEKQSQWAETDKKDGEEKKTPATVEAIVGDIIGTIAKGIAGGITKSMAESGAENIVGGIAAEGSR